MREIRGVALEVAEVATSPELPTLHVPGIVAGFSVWLLEAFDFFLVTFLPDCDGT